MLANSICNLKKTKKSDIESASTVSANLDHKICQKKNVGIAALNSNRKQLLAQFINQMVASTVDLPPEKLLQCNRGKANAARARQMSIYLMHTTLSFSYTEIGKIYSKDRTTIAHACHVIEDLRDNESFDLQLNRLERIICTVLRLSDVAIPGVVKHG